MARPTEVTDEEIIEVARKLSAAGFINATRLWNSLGRRGRPDRLLKVWLQHETIVKGSADNASSSDLPPVPEKAQTLADGLKSELSDGIDRPIRLIYAAVDDGVRGRYRDEIAETTATRDACSREVDETLSAMGDLSETLAARDETVETLSAALATATEERGLAEALSGAESRHRGDLVTRLAKIEAGFEIERQRCLDLRVAHAKAEEGIGFLRSEKAEWLEERERFRAASQRQVVDFALLQTENRQHLSTISAQQLTIAQLNGSIRFQPINEDTTPTLRDKTPGAPRARTMGAVRSHPPRPRTTATSLVKTDLGHDDTLVFNGGN